MRTQLLLQEFRRRTDHVKVYTLRDQSTPALDVFRKKFSVMPPETLFILADLGNGRQNQRQVDITELYEGNPTTGELSVYKGEPIMVHVLQDLGGAAKRIVYESEGHRETLTADPKAMGLIANFLKINEGVEFRRLPLADYKIIPIDCELLMIMAPEQPFQEAELDTIRDFIERGGSLLVTIRPKVKTGLERLLEDYGVKVESNIVCDPVQFIPPYITNLRLIDFNNHPVNRGMSNIGFEFPSSCEVEAIPKKDRDFTITPLAMASASSWGEKGDITPGNPPKQDADELGNNKKVIVVVEKNVTRKDARRKTAKIDVWGSSLPFTNSVL